MRPHEFAQTVHELASRHRPFAMATVIRTEGSTLARRGFKILISHEGRVVAGTFGGGCPEGPIVEVAQRAMADGEGRVVRVHLVDAAEAISGMARHPPSDTEIWVETDCGGILEVHVEPMMPSERLVIVGQGGKDDVEEALVAFARALDFEVWVVDPNPQLRTAPDRVVTATLPDPTALGLGERDSIVVLTKGERDVAVLQSLAGLPVRYVGLLASRHRREKDLAELRSREVAEEYVGRLHCPIGLDIGAKSPGEIAVAILAEVVAARHGKGTGSEGRTSPHPAPEPPPAGA